MSLGEYLKSLRKQSGYTIGEVVARSNGVLDKTTISRIERDKRGLSLKAAYAFARIYGISLEVLSEYATGVNVKPGEAPFRVSKTEEKLISRYRRQSVPRKKVINDIFKGLSMIADNHASGEAGARLKKALRYELQKEASDKVNDNETPGYREENNE